MNIYVEDNSKNMQDESFQKNYSDFLVDTNEAK